MINFKNKKITVMGLGLHGGGVGVTKWLAKQGAKILVTDLKDKKTLLPSIKKLKGLGIEYILGKHRAGDFKNTDIVIKNPGVPRESEYLKIASRNKIPIETDISLFFQLCPAPIIGITGTKGKSTLTTLIYEIFKHAGKKPIMAGNIRISPLEQLNKIKKNTPVILELSSWQLEDMAHLKRSPHFAVLTNIMPDHMNRYKNMDEYIKSKKLIFQWQTKNDYIILNKNNQITYKLGNEITSQRFWYSKKYFQKENGCFVKNHKIIFRNKGKEKFIFQKNNIKIPGEHNLEHTLAAVIVAKLNKIKNLYIKKAVHNFKGVSGRMELIRKFNSREFYNDTTATTPDAAIASINALNPSNKNNFILIAGGADKNLDFKEFAYLIKKKIKILILLKGTATEKIIKELKIIGKQWLEANSMEQVVKKAYQSSKKGDIILLSPGAASFGLFIHEFDRGNQFVKEVKKIR